MKRILLIKGKSQYDSTTVFMDEMKEELELQGMTVDVLDSYDQVSFVEMRSRIQQETYDAVFSINGMALEKSSSLGPDLLKNQVIYGTMLMDHPLIHHERLMNPYPYSFILSPDRNHVNYLENYYPHIWCEGFLAHGGCQAKKIIPYRNRSINLSFMGSYNSPEKIWEGFQQYPPRMRLLLEGCCGYLLEHTDKTVEQAMQERMEALAITCSAADFAAVGSEFHMVDRYVRSYFRDKVLRTIVEAGIVIDVYGDGWDKLKGVHEECLRIHEKVDFKESLEIVGNSKISLNVMPWFKDGSHDRVFSAMLSGAVCLTDVSGYLEKECQDGEEILFYHLEKLEELPGRIRTLLEHDEVGEEIARNGKKLAEEKHTWAVRARELLDYLLIAEQRKNAGEK